MPPRETPQRVDLRTLSVRQLRDAAKLAEKTLRIKRHEDGSVSYYQATTRNSIAYTYEVRDGFNWRIPNIHPLCYIESGSPHSNTIQEANAALRSRLLKIGFGILEQ